MDVLDDKKKEMRLEQFKTVAENWDRIPTNAKNVLNGSIAILASIYCNDNPEKEKEHE